MSEGINVDQECYEKLLRSDLEYIQSLLDGGGHEHMRDRLEAKYRTTEALLKESKNREQSE